MSHLTDDLPKLATESKQEVEKPQSPFSGLLRRFQQIPVSQWLEYGVLAHHVIVLSVFGEVLYKRRFLLFYQYWAIGFGGLFDFLGNIKPIVKALDDPDSRRSAGLKQIEGQAAEATLS